jgi:hypothetical protein
MIGQQSTELPQAGAEPEGGATMQKRIFMLV